MRKAPNWYIPTDSVDGIWKQDVLRFLGQEFNLRVLVETGSCEAATITAVCNDFDEIYSIELAEFYYKIARRRTIDLKNVYLYLGNSVQLLDQILPKITVPILFWLDAHSSGGMTADAGDPLPYEIAAITRHAANSLVVIDDYQNAQLDSVTDAGVSLEGWERYFVSGEVIMHRGGYGDITKLFED